MKRMSLWFAALAAVCSLCTASVLAADITPAGGASDATKWDGTSYDTSWYNENDTEFTLTTAAQLAGLAKLVNEGKDTFAGKTIKLGATINLAQYEWTPIGDSDSVFAGTFDGAGNMVSAMNFDIETSKNGSFYYSGFFGYVKGATIKNVTFAEVDLRSSHRVGGVVGYVNANDAAVTTVSQITIGGKIVSEVDYAAGFALKIDASTASADKLVTFTDCVNNAEIIVENGTKVAGFVGNNNVGVELANCTNNGVLSVTNTAEGKEAHAGGIVCYAQGPVWMTKCSNAGAISSVSAGTGNVGGILSTSQTGGTFVLANCSNTGAITVTRASGDSGNVGGMIGRANNGHAVAISDCAQNGNVIVTGEGTTNAGLLLGYTDNYKAGTRNIVVDKTSVSGTIVGATNIGSLVGGVQDDYSIAVDSLTVPSSMALVGNFEGADAEKVAVMPVASIAVGDVTVYYTTLQAALDAANAGDTVTLLADCTISEMITIPADKNITIDGRGFTVSKADGCIATANVVKNPFDGVTLFYIHGKLTIKDLTIDAKGSAGASIIGVTVMKGQMDMHDSVIKGGYADAGSALFIDGTVNMYGGSIEGNSTPAASTGGIIWVYDMDETPDDSNAYFNMYSGKITGNTGGKTHQILRYHTNGYGYLNGEISGNSAQGLGGVLYHAGGGMNKITFGPDLVIKDNTMTVGGETIPTGIYGGGFHNSTHRVNETVNETGLQTKAVPGSAPLTSAPLKEEMIFCVTDQSYNLITRRTLLSGTGEYTLTEEDLAKVKVYRIDTKSYEYTDLTNDPAYELRIIDNRIELIGLVTITFSAEGAEPATQTVKVGAGLPLDIAALVKVPTKSGYAFKAWYLSNGGYTFGADGTFHYTGNVPLTAQWEEIPPVAEVNGVKYETLVAAIDAARGGTAENPVVIQFLVGIFELGTVKFPAEVQNVTFRGAENKTTILKNTRVMAADGNTLTYTGITFDGIVFENSQITFTGWRGGNSTMFGDWAITNCEFRNIDGTVGGSGVSAVHFNLGEVDTMTNFTFSDNIVSNVNAGSSSGVHVNAVKGNIVFTNNVITDVAFNTIQIQNSDASSVTTIEDNILQSYGTGIVNLTNMDGTIHFNRNVFIAKSEEQWLIYSAITELDASENFFGVGTSLENVVWNKDFASRVHVNTSKGGSITGLYPTYIDVALTKSYMPEVAAIGDVTYPTLADAITAANAGDEITLLEDVSVSGYVNLNKSVTLNLNGKTVTSSSNGIVASANGIMIKNGTINGYYQAIYNNGYTTVTVENVNASAQWALYAAYGTIIVNGGTFTGTDSAIYNKSSAAVVINGGVFTSTGDASIVVENYGTLTIGGGKFTAPYTNATVLWSESGDIKISDGEFEIKNADNGGATAQVMNITAGTVEITGGTFTNPKKSYENWVGEIMRSKVKTTISGGIFNGVVIIETDQEVKMSGGTFNGGAEGAIPAANVLGLTVKNGSSKVKAIVGGTYKIEPADYVADGFKAQFDETAGMYNIILDGVPVAGTLDVGTLTDGAVGEGWSYAQKTLTISDDVKIVGTEVSAAVIERIDIAANADVVIEDLTLTTAGATISVAANATANVTINGDNKAGTIEVPTGATLNIGDESTGMIDAKLSGDGTVTGAHKMMHMTMNKTTESMPEINLTNAVRIKSLQKGTVKIAYRTASMDAELSYLEGGAVTTSINADGTLAIKFKMPDPDAAVFYFNVVISSP